MEILRLCAISVVTALLAMLLKQYKSPLAIPVTLCGGFVLLFFALPYLRDILTFAKEFAHKTGVGIPFIETLLKVIAVTFITECTVALCRDAGETALATKLEMAGKLIILGISMPLITSLFETIVSVLP